MSRFNLRQKPRISYYEPEEPSFDEYVFCDKCVDNVYEYCSIHGPLLVVPDDKVPTKTNLPSYIPRAALTIPHVFLHIAPSIIPGAGLGIFSTLTLPRGVRFGPYRGQKTMEVDNPYCWQIYDRNNKPAHVIDASDANKSNWMRYVNCSRHWCEQNLVAYQYQGQLYYRTIRIIPRFTELLVFYGSEFANSLHIDLRRYNSPAGLKQVFGEPLPKKPRLETKEKTDQGPQKETMQENQSDPKNKSHFDFKEITDKLEEKENNITPTKNFKPSLETIDNTTKDDKNNNKITSNNVYKCNDCGQQFIKKSDLIKHIESHDKIKRDIYFKCPECTYQTVTKDTLEKHMKLHDKNRLFVCDLCGHRFGEKNQLRQHSDLVHSTNKKHECGICDYRTNDIRSLNKHLMIHTGDKPFSCSKCEFKCRKKSDLTRHLRTHSGEKPFSCSICEFKCNQKSVLTRHLRTHTGEKPFSCSICEFKCNQKSVLTRHLRTHTGEKPFSCSICEFKCSQKSHLTSHLRTHTGEKPYSCSICGFKFSLKQNLTCHLRIHSGEKPFSCSICEFKCRQKSDLTRHLRTHSGEKPFSCSMCQHKYIDKRSLTNHLKTHNK